MKLLVVLALVLSMSQAQAASLSLAKHGGAVAGDTTMTIGGDPGTPFLLLFALAEQATVVNPHATLAIPLSFIDVAIAVPGFLGTIGANGQSLAEFQIPPDDARLHDSTLSFQAIGGECADQLSNLVRVTPALIGSFEPTLDAPDLPIVGGAALTRADGTILFVGGSGPVAQTYDPNLEQFTLGGVSFGAGLLSQSTALADGRILFTGGLGGDGQPTNAAGLFNPADGTTETLSMLHARAGHGASQLPDGRVLISGGFETLAVTDIGALFSGVQASSELFDPTTASFVAGPNMLEPRALHTSTTLTSGTVLVAGGLSILPIVNIPLVSNTAYAFNPATGSFGLPQFFTGARMLHSAVAMSDGRCLLVGGITLDLTAVLTTGDLTMLGINTLEDALVYSPGLFGNFQVVTGLSGGRAAAGVAVLPGGDVLVAGGLRVNFSTAGLDFQLQNSVDRFHPGNPGLFSATGSLQEARALPLLVGLNDGTLLVVGGSALSAEVYQP